MPSTPLGATPSGAWQYITADGFGFTSILRTIEICLMIVNSELTREYDANFRGITEALFDLAQGLAGHLAKSTVGDLPPGSYMDGETLVSVAPPDGSLWFDTRQGRMFVSDENGWFQTNGAEALIHVGPLPPANAQGVELKRPGQPWLCTLDGRTYVYVGEPEAQGEPGWYEFAGGGGSVQGTGVYSNSTGIPGANTVTNIVTMSLAAYSALPSTNPNTVYLLTD